LETELVETLREQVAYLQGVIATRDRKLEKRAEEIRRRDMALEREQQLAAMFADRLRELEAPASSSETREWPTAGSGLSDRGTTIPADREEEGVLPCWNSISRSQE
jgi:hypothetical protein